MATFYMCACSVYGVYHRLSPHTLLAVSLLYLGISEIKIESLDTLGTQFFVCLFFLVLFGLPEPNDRKFEKCSYICIQINAKIKRLFGLDPSM